MARPRAVLLHVMTQDPSVLAGGRLIPVQPVVAKANAGFWEGPACERVAVVDVSAEDGSLRQPAVFEPKGSPYRGVALYRSATPKVEGAGSPWSRGSEASVALEQLSDPTYTDAFLKVSVFGTVIRAIGFVEDPVVLGRRVEWAFPGRQLLVVPRAGMLDNAFYHRASRSLQFFSFMSPERPDRVTHTGLSQDIVIHETAHALIDGIARDLYDAVAPDSLAIHECVADVTAAMISLRNREQGFRQRPTPEAALTAMLRSSRYSRVAEEFGRSRGHGDSLRDALNDRTLHPLARSPRRVVDALSPHSLSEVMTGAIFAVLVRSLRSAMTLELKVEADRFRAAAIHTINRVGSLVFRGLDWLPPGEVTLADFAKAMLAADRFHHPDRPDERTWLADECAQRRIATRGDLAVVLEDPEGDPVDIDAEHLAADPDAARRLVRRIRGRIGVPAGPFGVECLPSVRSDRPLVQDSHAAEIVPLDRDYPAQPGAEPVALLKVSWWVSQPVVLPTGFPERCDVKVGTTLAIGAGGRVRAVLRGGIDEGTARRREAFLQRIAESGALLPPGRSLGPDGEPLRGAMHTTFGRSAMRVSGSFQALHIAGPI